MIMTRKRNSETQVKISSSETQRTNKPERPAVPMRNHSFETIDGHQTHQQVIPMAGIQSTIQSSLPKSPNRSSKYFYRSKPPEAK